MSQKSDRLLDLAGEIESCRPLFDDEEAEVLGEFVAYIKAKAMREKLKSDKPHAPQ